MSGPPFTPRCSSMWPASVPGSALVGRSLPGSHIVRAYYDTSEQRQIGRPHRRRGPRGTIHFKRHPVPDRAKATNAATNDGLSEDFTMSETPERGRQAPQAPDGKAGNLRRWRDLVEEQLSEARERG